MATGAAVAEDIRQPGSQSGRQAASGAGKPEGKLTGKLIGRLGLEDGSSFTFIKAVDAAASALEGAGIAVVPDPHGAAPGMRLRCPGFQVQMRLRRPALAPRRRPRFDLLQPAALLDLSVLPDAGTPQARDDAQTVLAGLLRQLVPALEATSVEWLDTGVLLTSEQFLDASGPLAARPAQPAGAVQQLPRVQPARVLPVPESTAAPRAASRMRPRGRACFAPVELAAQRIDAQCEQVLQQARDEAGSNTWQETAAEPARSPAPGKALPFARFAALLPRLRSLLRLPAPGSARAGQMRFAGQVLMLAFLIFFAETTGVVQAARPLLP
ncbi:hypothetical protein [Cribrihabitans pelagius]|uniref:hypothetical protein n=1 Tax=Cribrihabitans pelagius TaxID=1765746 RepID=UPI003B59FFDC